MNINALKVNFSALDTGNQVLFKLILLADEYGNIKTSKTSLALELGKSRECIAQHINKLVAARILKYKYSGAAYLNPEIIFKGSEFQYKHAIELYNCFKSDVI